MFTRSVVMTAAVGASGVVAGSAFYKVFLKQQSGLDMRVDFIDIDQNPKHSMYLQFTNMGKPIEIHTLALVEPDGSLFSDKKEDRLFHVNNGAMRKLCTRGSTAMAPGSTLNIATLSLKKVVPWDTVVDDMLNHMSSKHVRVSFSCMNDFGMRTRMEKDLRVQVKF
jgi:hypothetical protein